MGLATSLILLTVNVKSQAEQERECTVTSADLSKLTFDVFDQGLDSPLSWRCLADREDFRQAQELIKKFIMTNAGKLDQYDVRNLYFHSGQLAALDGRYENAIEKFSKAIDDNDGTFHFLSWNEYVSGTIHFLRGDIKKLEQEIKKIESKNLEMDSVNLRILKNFLRCPNETYKKVNSLTSCVNTD